MVSSNRNRRKAVLWSVAITALACGLGVMVFALSPQWEPIPDESIVPVMPIVTD